MEMTEMPDFGDDVTDAPSGTCLKQEGGRLCGVKAKHHVIRKDGSATEVCDRHLEDARWQADWQHPLTDGCLEAGAVFLPDLNTCMTLPAAEESTCRHCGRGIIQVDETVARLLNDRLDALFSVGVWVDVDDPRQVCTVPEGHEPVQTP